MTSPPTMPAPDFVGGQIIYDEAQMREIYEKGRGSVRVRAKYNAVPGENMLEITQIPPHHHSGKPSWIKSRAGQGGQAERDQRHARRDRPERPEADAGPQAQGVDADKLMAKLFKRHRWKTASAPTSTFWSPASPESWACGKFCRSGRRSGWSASAAAPTTTSTAREKRLHLLQGLAAILLDIDKAIHHPHHGRRDGSGPQPDDRLWHRRGAGGLWPRSSSAT